MTDARVVLWGSMIGAVSWLEDREIGVFQYAPEFLASDIQIAPLMMPLNEFPYEFPALPRNTFKGLPGLLADSLPDKFGNAVIDAWLASQGRSAESFNSVERLCYVGKRGMGALEFEPAILGLQSEQKKIEVAQLVDLANKILAERASLKGVFTGEDDREAMQTILRVGTSAGGARAKAILAWNPKTDEFRSGQIDSDPGFEYWLLKFDGVKNNRDKELADPLGYGIIEYAYYFMATSAGIKMTECRLHKEGGRNHFMTKRFDRYANGKKLHMQSLCAMAHYDYNQPASYSYEQAINVMKRLNLSREDIEQQVLRAMFNVIACNQDDHVKNIAFLMNRGGEWRLSPAFDVTYAYDPMGQWTSRHQMSINGKPDSFSSEDLIALAKTAGIKEAQANEMIHQVIHAVEDWPKFAGMAGVGEVRMEQIQQNLKIHL
ncbi:MAG TPA: toxin HipA [Clostridiales bacterium]|nr:toxin HipA [Clostridiales bacterium]